MVREGGMKLDRNLLKTIPDDYKGVSYTIEISSRKLSSLCPVDGKPDYYEIRIVYQPNGKIIELNSLEEYFMSFYNDTISHEAKVNIIFEDLWSVLSPSYLGVELIPFAREGLRMKVWREGGCLREEIHKKES